MRTTVPLGRIAGVPVGAHWSALVGVVLLGYLLALGVLPMQVPGLAPWTYWLAGGLAALGLVVSLLAHELGHAIVARRSGVTVQRITLWLLGGVSEFGDQPQQAAAEVRIAVVGPVVSLVLGGLFVTATWLATGLGAPALALVTLVWLGAMNLLLGLFNLLPGTPLDGGRVLHGLLWQHSGNRDRATRTVTSAGQFLGTALATLGVLLMLTGRWDGLWLVLVGWFLIGAAAAERSQAALTAGLSGLRAGDVMIREPDTAPAWWTVDTFASRLLSEGRARHRYYPVVDVDGLPSGVVRLADLSALPAAARRDTLIKDVARALPADLVVTADTPLDRLVRRLGAGRGVAVVTADRRIAGIITTTDLSRTVQLGGRRGSPAAVDAGDTP